MLGRSLRMVKIKVAQQGSSLVLGEPARRADSNGTIGLPWQAVQAELASAKNENSMILKL